MLVSRDSRVHVVHDMLTLGQALEEGEKASRRVGAMLLVDGEGRLSGILTDADLRRVLVKHRRADILDRPVAEFMIRNPKHIHLGELASRARR